MIRIGNIEITESKFIANEIGKFFATIGYNTAMKGRNRKTKIEDYLKNIPNESSTVFLTPCTAIEVGNLLKKPTI